MKNRLSRIENYLESIRDRFLIKEIMSGNSVAFATLMALYQKRVEAVGMRFFHNNADTEDFVQEVFLKVFKNLSTFNGQSKFSTWLTKIAFTTAIDSAKTRKDVENLSNEDEICSNIDDPEEENLKAATRQAVQEAIRELPEQYGQCLELYFFLGMNYEDISETTGVPVNTIKSHIFRAKRTLFEKLKEYK